MFQDFVFQFKSEPYVNKSSGTPIPKMIVLLQLYSTAIPKQYYKNGESVCKVKNCSEDEYPNASPACITQGLI